ncbi:hypothetical protein LCER1_G004110 [Lachnellula cervina]|uniref:Uncharacterized protein n=1 Tax=Lachnellula cervina TaxID=1316786 RepID=A0A7D8Z0P8_9HELO|nr:hypothetical protein LCER1_G004110 [Lachnellula cervina]
MSSILSFGMPSSKKEKHYANSRARRHSGDVVISQSKKSKKEEKKEKDADTESISSSTASSAAETVVVPPPPEPKKCPLRFMMAGMLQTEQENEEKKVGGCPLRRVQLWHTIPLCLLAAVNLLLIIFALLGLAGYRIGAGICGWVSEMQSKSASKPPAAQSLIDIDDGSEVVGENAEKK